MCKTVSELSYKIKALKESQKYLEAMEVFKTQRLLLSVSDIAKDAYLLSHILFCMRKQSMFTLAFQCFQYFRQANGGEMRSSHWNALLWVFYDALKQEKSQSMDETLLTEAIDKVQQDGSEFSVKTVNMIFQQYAKHIKSMQNVPWQRVEKVLSVFKIEFLSKEVSEVTLSIKGKEKRMELSSNFEEYYVLLSKAYFDNLKFSECIVCCDEALLQIKEFHYKNHIWFKYRKSLAMMRLMQYSEAYKILTQLNKREDLWFIQKAISECMFYEGRVEEALQMSLQAFTNGGDEKYKGELILFISEIYKQMGDVEKQKQYSVFYCLLRQHNGWKIGHEHIQYLERANVKNSEYNYESMRKELHYEAGKSSFRIERNSNEKLEVKLVRILNQNERGVDGFVEDGAGNSYYFSLSSSHKLISSIKVGTKYRAQIEFNEKKRKNSAKLLSVV